MAIFHLSTRTSRIPKTGKSVNALNHYEYITRQGKYSATEDLTYMETGRRPNCDELKSYKDFWKAADEYKRRNGRTYREVTIGLQEEFTKEENIELIHKFLDHFGIRENQVYAFAIHDKQASYDVHHRNVHCHIMFNERIVTNRKFEYAGEVFKQWAGPIKQNERGGLQVDRYFNNRNFVTDMRNYWEKINNEKFEEIGSEIRISSKSLKEQREKLIDEGRYEEAEAFDRAAPQHMGPAFKYPDVQEEVMAMVSEIENKRDEDLKHAEEQVIAALQKKGIPYEGMQYYTQAQESQYIDDEEIENESNKIIEEDRDIDFVELLAEESLYQAESEVAMRRDEEESPSENTLFNEMDLEKEIMPQERKARAYRKAYKDEYEKNAEEMIEEIVNGKISKETFDKLVSLQFRKLQAERKTKEENERKQNSSSEDLNKEIFEQKKRLMAEDIVLRRIIRLAQLDKADLDTQRQRRVLHQMKKYGFDESIATDGVIITVKDVCEELKELRNKESVKIVKLKEKIKKRDERAQVNTPNEVLAMDRLTDGNYSKTMKELNELNSEIKELQKVTRAPMKDMNDYFAKSKKEKEIKVKRDLLQKTIDKQLAKAHGEFKDLYYTYLKKIAKEKKIAEKYNNGDMEAIVKHQELKDLLDERRTTLAKTLPKETILYGDTIPEKVYLTSKIDGVTLNRKPFLSTRNGVYMILNTPKEPEFGKQIDLQCVKLGEEAPMGKAKVYNATVLVEQKKKGANGKIIPQYIPLAVAPTEKNVLLYGVNNKETRLKLNPQTPNGKGRSIKVIASNKGPRITVVPQSSCSPGQSALAQLLQNSVAGTATIRDKVQPDEKSADRKSAEAAKRDDVTKDMALENEKLENGEWVQQMRQSYGRRR